MDDDNRSPSGMSDDFATMRANDDASDLINFDNQAVDINNNVIDNAMDEGNGSESETDLLEGADLSWPTPGSSCLLSPMPILTPINSPLHVETVNANDYISEFARELAQYETEKFEKAVQDRMNDEEWTTPMKKIRREGMQTLPSINKTHNNDIRKRHPSGELVRLYDVTWKKHISTRSTVIPFPPLMWTGYSNMNFVKHLFPRFGERPRRTPSLNPYDFMEFQYTVEFRERTYGIVCDADAGYLNLIYTSPHPQFNLPLKDTKTTIAPIPTVMANPVLYQVVRRDEVAQVLILEAKDFFTFIDGREDLRLLRLTKYATDLLNERTGFDINQVSVSDLIWVHDVEIAPTGRTLAKRQKIFENMKKAQNSLIYVKTPSILFNVTHFTLVTPSTKIRKTLGIVTNYPGEQNGHNTKIEIVMENSTAPCSINMDSVPFSMEEVPKESLIWTDAREPTTHSCRFSASPIGPEQAKILHEKIATIWPIRMEESPSPTGIHKIDNKSLAKIKDRIEGFSSYGEDPQKALTQLALAYNVSCARLADAANSTEDKVWHHVDVSIISATPHLVSVYGILENRFHENGYIKGRQVLVIVEGFSRVYYMRIEKSELMPRKRTKDLGIYLTALSRHTVEFYDELCKLEKERCKMIHMSFILSDNAEQSDPLSAYMIRITDIPLNLEVNGGRVLHQTFSKIIPTNEVDDVSTIDTTSLKFEQACPDNIILQVQNRANRTIKLGEQQKIAIRAGLDLQQPVINIQSAYGSGKTLTLATLAALASIKMLGNRIVIITAVTNSAVAQAINTITQLADYRKDIVALRFVNDNAATDHPTDVDIVKILEYFENNHGLEMTLVQMARLREFLERRKHMFQLKNNKSLSDIPIADQEEYKISETRCSEIARNIIQMMFSIRMPNVIGITLSALLNATEKGGILESYLATNAERLMIINDESSQTPEPALTALALRFPKATFRFFGDRHQLQPYCRIKPTCFAARCGARGLASILSEAAEIPKVTLAETFRSHPDLNDLPNQMFYNNHLISGTLGSEREDVMKKMDMRYPSVFINIYKGEAITLNGGTSLKNEQEAQLTIKLANRLMQQGVNKEDLAVICIYNEQKRYIQHLNPALNVFTVDSVQGKEFEVVILLTTRTSTTYNAFMDEPTRTCVAITRARCALFTLGNRRALNTIPLWRTIISHHGRKNAIMSEVQALQQFKL